MGKSIKKKLFIIIPDDGQSSQTNDSERKIILKNNLGSNSHEI
jgi:hypothetical protein